jgi:hypothetical protein
MESDIILLLPHSSLYVHVHSPRMQGQRTKQGLAAVRATRASTPPLSRLHPRKRKKNQEQEQERFLCSSRNAERKPPFFLTKYCSICKSWHRGILVSAARGRGSRYTIPRTLKEEAEGSEGSEMNARVREGTILNTYSRYRNGATLATLRSWLPLRLRLSSLFFSFLLQDSAPNDRRNCIAVRRQGSAE